MPAECADCPGLALQKKVPPPALGRRIVRWLRFLAFLAISIPAFR
jgi:hypothetical protein